MYVKEKTIDTVNKRDNQEKDKDGYVPNSNMIAMT
jgi:hypothetical protein